MSEYNRTIGAPEPEAGTSAADAAARYPASETKNNRTPDLCAEPELPESAAGV